MPNLQAEDKAGAHAFNTGDTHGLTLSVITDGNRYVKNCEAAALPDPADRKAYFRSVADQVATQEGIRFHGSGTTYGTKTRERVAAELEEYYLAHLAENP